MLSAAHLYQKCNFHLSQCFADNMSSNSLYCTPLLNAAMPRCGGFTYQSLTKHTLAHKHTSKSDRGGCSVSASVHCFPLINCEGQKALDGNYHGNRFKSRAELAQYPSAPCCMLSREHVGQQATCHHNPWQGQSGLKMCSQSLNVMPGLRVVDLNVTLSVGCG